MLDVVILICGDRARSALKGIRIYLIYFLLRKTSRRRRRLGSGTREGESRRRGGGGKPLCPSVRGHERDGLVSKNDAKIVGLASFLERSISNYWERSRS